MSEIARLDSHLFVLRFDVPRLCRRPIFPSLKCRNGKSGCPQIHQHDCREHRIHGDAGAQVGAREDVPCPLLRCPDNRHNEDISRGLPKKIWRSPSQIGIELVVQRPRKQQADEVGREHCRHDILRGDVVGDSKVFLLSKWGLEPQEGGDHGGERSSSRLKPSLRDEDKKCCNMASKKRYSKRLAEEYFLAQHAPVDRPLKLELAR